MDTLEDANFTKSVLHHREKRAFPIFGKFGKFFSKAGVVYCATGVLCPVGKGLKKLGKLYTKGGKSFTKLAPKVPFIDLKNAKTANPISATKNVLKVAPAVVKAYKKLG